MENQLANYHFNLELKSVLNFMGYADPEKARAKIVKIAEEEMQRTNEWADSWGHATDVSLCGIKDEEIFLKKTHKIGLFQ